MVMPHLPDTVNLKIEDILDNIKNGRPALHGTGAPEKMITRRTIEDWDWLIDGSEENGLFIRDPQALAHTVSGEQCWFDMLGIYPLTKTTLHELNNITLVRNHFSQQRGWPLRELTTSYNTFRRPWLDADPQSTDLKLYNAGASNMSR